MAFYVKDKALKGGGFTDTLSNTWKKVKQFVSESPLAQKVVKRHRAPQCGTARAGNVVKTGFPPACGATAARTKL